MASKVARILPISCVAIALALSSCSGGEDERPQVEQPVLATGLSALPASSAVAWRTYADHVVLVKVEKESTDPITKDEREADEGLVVRRVSLQVEKTLWTQPETAQPVPTELSWTSGGWVFHGSDRQQVRRDGVPWLIVGHEYVVPISYTALIAGDDGDQSWIPLGSENAMPADGGVVGNGERILIGKRIYDGVDPAGATPMRDSVWRQPIGTVADTLDKTQVDKAAAPYMKLSPIDRYTAVENG